MEIFATEDKNWFYTTNSVCLSSFLSLSKWLGYQADEYNANLLF